MSFALRYDDFTSRLQHITMAVGYALHAVHAKAETIQLKDVESAIERFTTDVNTSFRQATGNPMPRTLLAQATEPLKKMLFIGDTAGNLLLNLGLVMLCTQFELFINHLLDVVLATEPRRLKDLASKKCVTAGELVDLDDYPAVMQRLRDKVIEEVDRAGAREKFSEHLSKRFNLIEESEIKVVPPPGADQKRFEGWNLDKLVLIFEQRHGIVHRGTLPVTDIDYLARVTAFFDAIQTTLTINAIERYDIDLDPPTSLFLVGVLGKLYGVSEASLAQIRQKWEDRFISPHNRTKAR